MGTLPVPECPPGQRGSTAGADTEVPDDEEVHAAALVVLNLDHAAPVAIAELNAGSVVLHDPDANLTIVAFRSQAQVRTAAIEPMLKAVIEALA
jgi:hypothetical protein